MRVCCVEYWSCCTFCVGGSSKHTVTSCLVLLDPVYAVWPALVCVQRDVSSLCAERDVCVSARDVSHHRSRTWTWVAILRNHLANIKKQMKTCTSARHSIGWTTDSLLKQRAQTKYHISYVASPIIRGGGRQWDSGDMMWCDGWVWMLIQETWCDVWMLTDADMLLMQNHWARTVVCLHTKKTKNNRPICTKDERW